MSRKRKLFFDWPISDHHGWGIYGFNLLLNGLMNRTLDVIPLQNQTYFLYPVDPLSNRFIAEHLPATNTEIELQCDDIILRALGNSNDKLKKSVSRDIGVIFFETNPLPQHEIQNLLNFEFVVAGSTWNRSSIEQSGVRARTIVQGIDLELFRAAPKRLLRDQFVIFSGGKLEYRKGQDILLKAFANFAARHDDVVLVTAWRSPWEKQIAISVNQSNLCKPLCSSDDMGKSIYEWVLQNGVKPSQVICLNATPNRLMPEVFREVDLAVFPSRCEGGTNLVAMEALAYGLPCLISKNTGHLDIIQPENCLPLLEQKPIDGWGRLDWGESSIDEIVDLMEQAYQGRAGINRLKARESMLSYSWENAINSLLALF